MRALSAWRSLMSSDLLVNVEMSRVAAEADLHQVQMKVCLRHEPEPEPGSGGPPPQPHAALP
jgi:hypothetical protein